MHRRSGGRQRVWAAARGCAPPVHRSCREGRRTQAWGADTLMRRRAWGIGRADGGTALTSTMWAGHRAGGGATVTSVEHGEAGRFGQVRTLPLVAEVLCEPLQRALILDDLHVPSHPLAAQPCAAKMHELRVQWPLCLPSTPPAISALREIRCEPEAQADSHFVFSGM
jgi:hypothetical protein